MAPIKVVTAENGKLFLNEEVLKNLMLRQDLLNLNVIVISVAGRVYQDKSFILNFLVRYLKHKHDNKTEDWLEKDDRLEGFWYENSVEKITNGIFIWDEIFKVRTESNEEVAIILMDTQGLFSLESTIQDAMNIIAFSLFSASVQIYNLTQNVCGDDLSYLHLFTAYSESMGDEVGLQNGPKFQDLVLFFREWQHSPKCPFGVHGGDTYLEIVLSQSRAFGDTRTLRETIRSCFQGVRCFLMPHPGAIVTSEPFDDIESVFLKKLRHFINALMVPEQLTIKKINRQAITVNQLYHHMCKLVEIVSNNNNNTDVPNTLFGTVVQAINNATAAETLKMYTAGMRQFLHTPENFVSWRELDCKHRQQQAVAKGYFDKARKMGGKLAADQLYATISTRIDSAYEVFKRENQRAEYLKELREEQRREKERQLHTETMRMKSMRANDILLNQMEWYSNELRKQIVRLETEVNGLRKRTNVSREEQDGGSCILL